LQAGELAFIWMLIWGAKDQPMAERDVLPSAA